MSSEYDLNPSQLAVVTYSGDQHSIVLAGAGTGKTRTIVYRVAHLIKTGTPPHRILLLTFTRRAAKEMKDRLHLLIGSTANEVVAGTFHWFALAVIRKMPRAFGMEKVSVIDRGDQESLMQLARENVVKKGDKECPKASQLLDYCSYSRNVDIGHLDYLMRFTEHQHPVREQILRVFKEYEKKKAASRLLDFDDILFLFAQKIKEDPRVRDQIRQLFSYHLIDEFQDTNPIQYRILDLIRDPGILMAVGDIGQSLYAFRGADYRNAYHFTERIDNSRVFKLELNYRSTQEILDLSNWLLDRSTLDYGIRLKSFRGHGVKPKIIDFASALQEGRWVADDILERHEAGAKFSDHMILVRTAWSARYVEAALAERRIAYVLIGGSSMFAAAHVKDMLSLLRLTNARLLRYCFLTWIVRQ